MDIKKFYLSDYEGRSGASSIKVGDGELKRLPDQPCKFAVISNWNVQDVPSFTIKATGASGFYDDSADEVYYGFNGIIMGQIMPARSTELLPVNNLNQICVRTRPGDSITIWYAWFW